MIANTFPAMSDESDEFLPTRVSLLGSRRTDVAWRQKSKDVVVTMPVIGDGELPFSGPRVMKIEGATLP